MIDLACDPNFFSEPLKGKEPRGTSDEEASAPCLLLAKQTIWPSRPNNQGNAFSNSQNSFPSALPPSSPVLSFSGAFAQIQPAPVAHG